MGSRAEETRLIALIPKSLSASSLHVAKLCLARWEAEIYSKGSRETNTAAGLGTSVHGSLEDYVTLVYLKQERERSLKLLLDLFDLNYLKVFGGLDKSAVEYKDGVTMLTNWFNRGDLDIEGRTVISCESKTNFPIKAKASAGTYEVPFNYIWDRFDKTGEHEYTVVDYKSNRWNINPDELRKKIQARAYGLAAQIAYPDAERVWVEFDMLRFNEPPIGVVFSRDDNIETYREFQAIMRRILDTPEGESEETLNTECLFCIRKVSCAAVQSNISVGGIMSVPTFADKVDLRAQLDYQRKAVDAALKELDSWMLAEAKEGDFIEANGNAYKFGVGVSYRRSVDPERAQQILGPDLWHKYGSTSITMDTIDNLLKGSELDPTQKSQLKAIIYRKSGEPKVRTSPL